MEFKDILREIRTKKGLTQEELGKQFNVIKQTVSSWENGNSRPDIEMAGRLADFFGVTVDELLGRATKPTKEKLEEIEKKFESLSLEQQKAFLKKHISSVLDSLKDI